MCLSKQQCILISVFVLASAIAQTAYAKYHPVTQAECHNMKAHQVLSPGVPVGCDRLSEVTFSYYDFAGRQHIDAGTVVVLDAVAKNVQGIFDALYRMRFPINKAVPIEAYEGDDDASMNDNNTSAFNGRKIVNGDHWSMHAYGAAIDINPYQNPYIYFARNGIAAISPASAAKASLNRMKYRPNKPDRSGVSEDVIDVFANHGFLGWGGYWNSPTDYQHFEIGSSALTKKLASEPLDKAQRDFAGYTRDYLDCMSRPAAKGPARVSHEKHRAECVAKTIRSDASYST